jgi:hypothetical protein
MKRVCIFGIALLSLITTARADLTIVQNVQGTEGLNRITFKIKGDLARVDINPQITTIINAKTGELLTLVNESKQVMRIPGDRARAMAEMARSLVGDDAAAQPAPKPTGHKETINGYETEEYVTDSPKYHARYWIAKNYPDGDSILKQMALLKNGAFASITKGMPNYDALPGLPLRTTIKIPGQSEITSTIESVNLSPLAASDFTAPADYSEVKMPGILGGQAPKPGP